MSGIPPSVSWGDRTAWVILFIAMRTRVVLAALLLVGGFALAAVDATVLQRLEPRDRIWLLVAYSALPALIGSLAVLWMRSTAGGAVIALAATLPPLFRFAYGGRSAEAAFDRLALNPLWFVLVWLPFGGAVVLLLHPAAAPRSRTVPFARRMWRFGAAITLLFVTTSFAAKSRGVDHVLIAFISFTVLIVGIVLLVSDVLPSRTGSAFRAWSWLGLTGVMIVASIFASSNVADMFSQRSHLEWRMELNRQSILEVQRSLKHYEDAGRLSASDRSLAAAGIAEYQQDIAADAAVITTIPKRLVAPLLLAVASVGVLLLFALLVADEWRERKRAMAHSFRGEGSNGDGAGIHWRRRR